MRTSFKVRFEVTRKGMFKKKKNKAKADQDQLNDIRGGSGKDLDGQIKKMAKREAEKINQEKPFVEFPIQLIYHDLDEDFVHPPERSASN